MNFIVFVKYESNMNSCIRHDMCAYFAGFERSIELIKYLLDEKENIHGIHKLVE